MICKYNIPNIYGTLGKTAIEFNCGTSKYYNLQTKKNIYQVNINKEKCIVKSKILHNITFFFYLLELKLR